MSPKILIVEDDPDLRLVLASSLSLGAFDSRTATHGREAMDLIRAEPFDAILMDLGLPDMEGTELLRAVRGLTTAPIIVVSGRDTERDKIEALYGPDESRSSKIVEVHLGHVRRKLQGLTGVDLIENRRGRGWILRPFH